MDEDAAADVDQPGDDPAPAGSAAGARPLAVHVAGEGPPLVAVHGGLLGGAATFGGVLPAWSRHHRVLVVDRPGFGETELADEAPGAGSDPIHPTLAAQAERLLATLAAEAGGEPVHAVGTSVGGLVVLRAVQRRPEAFATLTLVEVPAEDLCPGDAVEPVRLGALGRQVHAALEGVAPEELAAPGGPLEQFATTVDPLLWQVVAARLRRGDPEVRAHRADLAIWTAHLDRLALADAVSGDPPIAVLTVSGTRSDPAFRTYGACTAAALAGRHVVLDGAGHAAHLHPAFTDLLLDHTGAVVA